MTINRKEDAKQLIERLGGPAKVAEMLGFKKSGGVQRVQNWKERGIPASVILDHQSVFAPEKNVSAET